MARKKNPKAGEPNDGNISPELNQTLTVRQHDFVLAWLRTRCHAQAYIDAGYTIHTRKDAARNGYILFNKPKIQRYLRSLFKEELVIDEVAAASAMHQLKCIADSSIDKVATWDEGTGLRIRPMEQIDKASMYAISDIVETTYNGVRTYGIKMHNKLPALNLISKYSRDDPNRLIAKIRALGYDVVDRQALEVDDEEILHAIALLQNAGYEVKKRTEDLGEDDVLDENGESE